MTTMNQGLWIKKTTRQFKDQTDWAKLRVKTDSSSDESYMDILVGHKRTGWHAHIGISLDGTVRFAKYRGITHSIEREVRSIKRGLLGNEKILIDSRVTPDRNLVFRVAINGGTREVSIEEFRLDSLPPENQTEVAHERGDM